MEQMASLLPHLKQTTALSYEQYLDKQCKALNEQLGELQGYDCPQCRNKGCVYVVSNGAIAVKPCACQEMRRSMKRIEKSGLGDLLDTYTFARYKAEEGWQKKLLAAARAFADKPDGNWFFIGGQVGCGKTHICTAIVGEMLRRGTPAKYMLWGDEVAALKANVLDDAAYGRMMGPLKTTAVLYIDDFFRGNPTAADARIAFEILNARYNRRDLVTIISSERSIDGLLDVDEAVGSRIYERTRQYCFSIGSDPHKNYRMRGDANEQ